MSSRYMFFRSSAARRRICQAASVIAVCLLWTDRTAHVHAASDTVSLRGTTEERQVETPQLPEASAAPEAASPSADSDDAADLEQQAAKELVCDAVGKHQAVIRSTKDSIKLSCRGGFAVYDVPTIGEVFEADCKAPRALEARDMKATLDHSVDHTGAFRLLSVSNFPSENEQLCLACATGEGGMPISLTEVPESQMCAVVVTVVGTNNKDELPVEAQPSEQHTSEEASKQESTSEQEAPQREVPEEQPRQVSPPESPEARSPQHQMQHHRTTQKQPQQQGDQSSDEEPQPSQEDATRQPPAPVEAEDTQRSNRHGEDTDDAQEQPDTTANEDQQETSEDLDSSDENEARTTHPLQCTSADLHLSVHAGESVSFLCGNQMSLTPDTDGLIYEEGDGKCGKVKKAISDVAPEARVAKQADTTTVSLVSGASQDKTVCYRCMGSTEQHDQGDGAGTQAEGQPTECIVYITLRPNVTASPVGNSGVTAQSSSFLVGAVVFLGALLHLLQ